MLYIGWQCYNRAMTETHHPKEKKASLLKSSSVVGVWTLLSRVLGFLRDVIFARLFGASMATDAFFLAFKIPNFFRRMFAEGAFSQAFVPVLNEYKSDQPKELKALIANVCGTLAAILLLITTLAIAAAPLLTLLFAPGFADEPEKYALATDMLRITFPYLFFISLTAMAAGILNTFGRFAVPAFTPVLLNVCLITAALLFTRYFDPPIMAVAWGVFFAGLVQLLFQLPFLWKLGLLPMPRWGWWHAGVKKIIKLMLPILFGASVVQLNLLIDTLLASLLQTGSISWLYYSDRLVEFPLGIFGVAIATVILPSLSRKHSEKSTEAFSATLDWALRFALLICIPATVGLVMLAAPFLSTLFQYGKFDAFAVEMASYSLMAYALGLPAFILIKVFTPAFYSRQDTKTPVKIGLIAVGVNLVLKVIIVIPMITQNFFAPHIGLALTTVLAAWVQAFLFYRYLKRGNFYTPQSRWWPYLLKVLLAVICMGLCIYFMEAYWAFDMQAEFWSRAVQSFSYIAAGATMYFLVLLLLGTQFKQLIKQH